MITKIKKLRILNDMTQVEISKKLGISQSLYSLIENGKRKPSKEIAEKIERLFGVSMHFID
ncbi:helix-turn-helix transcriptional regulator [Thermolongibacillus altinsuensis]